MTSMCLVLGNTFFCDAAVLLARTEEAATVLLDGKGLLLKHLISESYSYRHSAKHFQISLACSMPSVSMTFLKTIRSPSEPHGPC